MHTAGSVLGHWGESCGRELDADLYGPCACFTLKETRWNSSLSNGGCSSAFRDSPLDLNDTRSDHQCVFLQTRVAGKTGEDPVSSGQTPSPGS